MSSTPLSLTFYNKHGEKVFNQICELIRNETKSKCDSMYIEKVFQLSFWDYIGIMISGPDKSFMSLHEKSIKMIQSFFVV